MSKIQLHVVSQERELLNVAVDSITAPTTGGEITVLPNHIALMTTLQPGEVVYRVDGVEANVVVSKGFLMVAPGGDAVTVLVDNAVHAREVSEEAAAQAIKRAQETIQMTKDERERVQAEAELRYALLQMKVAERTKRNRV